MMSSIKQLIFCKHLQESVTIPLTEQQFVTSIHQAGMYHIHHQ